VRFNLTRIRKVIKSSGTHAPVGRGLLAKL
jgi:hypothetical protein